MIRAPYQPRRAPDAVFDFKPLIDIRDRLQALVVKITGGDLRQRAPGTLEFPHLTWLKFTLVDGSPGELDTLAEFFSDAPCLRTLGLSCERSRLNPQLSNLRFPWDQLTSLTLSVPVEDVVFYELLKACPLLEECSLEKVVDGNTIRLHPTHTMRALRSFDFTPAKGSFGYILQHLNLPSLQSLTLSWNGGHALLDPAEMLIRLHERAPFALHDLNLNSVYTRTDGLIRLLHCLAPSLKTLSLLDMPYCTPGADGIFSIFTRGTSVHAQSGLRLPHLTVLMLQQESDVIDGGALLSMLDSLCVRDSESGGPFPSLRLVDLLLYGSALNEAQEMALARMVNESDGFLRDHWVRPWAM